MGLYKTTMVIWSDYDVSDIPAEMLVRDAIHGSSYMTGFRGRIVAVPSQDPDFDEGMTEFFGMLEEGDNGPVGLEED